MSTRHAPIETPLRGCFWAPKDQTQTNPPFIGIDKHSNRSTTMALELPLTKTCPRSTQPCDFECPLVCRSGHAHACRCSKPWDVQNVSNATRAHQAFSRARATAWPSDKRQKRGQGRLSSVILSADSLLGPVMPTHSVARSPGTCRTCRTQRARIRPHSRARERAAE